MYNSSKYRQSLALKVSRHSHLGNRSHASLHEVIELCSWQLNCWKISWNSLNYAPSPTTNSCQSRYVSGLSGWPYWHECSASMGAVLPVCVCFFSVISLEWLKRYLMKLVSIIHQLVQMEVMTLRRSLHERSRSASVEQKSCDCISLTSELVSTKPYTNISSSVKPQTDYVLKAIASKVLFAIHWFSMDTYQDTWFYKTDCSSTKHDILQACPAKNVTRNAPNHAIANENKSS